MQYKIDINLCFHPKKLMENEKTLIDEYMKKEGILPFVDDALKECSKDSKKDRIFDEQLRINTARQLRLDIIEKCGDEIRKKICDSCDDNYRCKFYEDYANYLKTEQ